MAYSEELAARIRALLVGETGLVEKKMFGGVAFMLDGNMAVGIARPDNLLVRVNPDSYEAAMSRPHTREFDMSGRLMNGWVVVEPDGIQEDEALARWVREGSAQARSLPPK